MRKKVLVISSCYSCCYAVKQRGEISFCLLYKKILEDDIFSGKPHIIPSFCRLPNYKTKKAETNLVNINTQDGVLSSKDYG